MPTATMESLRTKEKTMSRGTMRAIVNERYGSPDVLELKEMEEPVIGDDEVRIRVRAASVNPLDWHFMRGSPYFARLMTGLRRPKKTARGVDVSGEVEGVGGKVTQFQVGDEVFGVAGGALAEYASGDVTELAMKPGNLSFEQAATVPVAGCTALQALRDQGQLQAGQQVLINGAAGGVGTFAVQIAKAFGADVTGVCSTRNVDMVRSIGAEQVVDYTRKDFTKGGEKYDLIVDMIGNRSLRDLRRVLTPKGTAVLSGGGEGSKLLGPLPFMGRGLVMSRFVSQTLAFFLAKVGTADLVALTELIEAGKVVPVIDRTYPLSETREAIRYLETGHARGKVVVTP